MNSPAIDSPCVGICQIDKATRLCTGCARTLHEIAGWVQLGEAERSRIMAELPARRGKGAA
ncbi:MAG: DUF1289 domain-containing protein [Gammaproteobacteria bacterium]|nr:DUF1289 domain-containing protein [Gammaproteobacteria bacterium]